jgi:4-alpha-glucanotransferase
MDREITEPHWEMIRLAMASVAHTFVAPLQDILGFGADTRMNMPGKLGGNWTWRFTPEWLNFEPAKMRLIHYTRLYNRWTD